MDNKALLALWKLDEMPACKEGMMLAQAFLISCGEGVNRLGTEEPADRITDLTACYMALVEHGSFTTEASFTVCFRRTLRHQCVLCRLHFTPRCSYRSLLRRRSLPQKGRYGR
jgi:hypothetical protein